MAQGAVAVGVDFERQAVLAAKALWVDTIADQHDHERELARRELLV